MKQVKYITILISILIIETLYTYIAAYKQSQNTIEHRIIRILKKTIEYDYSKRSRTQVTSRASYPLYMNRKYKHTQLTSAEGTEIIEFKDSLDRPTIEKLIMQYMLSKDDPIKPINLDSIFNEFLKKENLHLNTGIAYVHKDSILYSKNKPIFFKKAFHTPKDTLDFKNAVIVQGFAEIDFITVLRNISIVHWIIPISLLLFSSGVIYFLLRPNTKKAKATNDEILLAHILAFGSIQLDTETQKLYIDHVEKPIKKYEYELLKLFLNDKNHFLMRDTIIKHFWSEKEDCEDRLNTIIYRLRLNLKEAKDIKLVNKRGTGYEIQCDSEDINNEVPLCNEEITEEAPNIN